MNRKYLKKDVGYHVRLVPSACYVDAKGEPTFVQDGDWTISAVDDDYIDIIGYAGQTFRLGMDHIRTFATDPQRSDDGSKHGFLQLHVQLFVCDSEVTAVPNHQPGASVQPPVNSALKARVTFAPDLERLMRRLVCILDRAMVNVSLTAGGVFGEPQTITTGDSWQKLMISNSAPAFSSAAYGDLLASDAQVLSEFYGAVTEVSELIRELSETNPISDYNSWNVLMHKAQHTVKLGLVVVKKFCPERMYDPTIPAAGTLLARSESTLVKADSTRNVVFAKLEALRQAQVQRRSQRR
jgi:hypothetical protein